MTDEEWEAARLAKLEWEAQPNEFRNRPRLTRRRRREPMPPMTPADWAAWGIDWTQL